MKHSDMKRKPGAAAAAFLPGAVPCPLFAEAPAAAPRTVEALRDLPMRQLARIEVRPASGNLLHKSHFESDDAGRAQRIERSARLGTWPRF